MEMAEHVTCVGEKRNAYMCFLGKPEEKEQHGKLSPTWKYNILVSFKGISLECLNWIHLAHKGDKWRGVLKTARNFHFN
jgi:hypothetical protein